MLAATIKWKNLTSANKAKDTVNKVESDQTFFIDTALSWIGVNKNMFFVVSTFIIEF